MPMTRSIVLDVVHALEPLPGRLQFSTRLALICALTVLVAEIYQTPEPALTTYVVFFLNGEDRVTSLILNIVMVVLLTIIIGLVILAAMSVADDPMWRVISIAILSFGFLFLAAASKLRPVGSTIALIVGYALDNLGKIEIGEEATRGFLYAWLFVGVPAGVSIVVNLLLAPAPRSLAEAAIASRLASCAALLRDADEAARERFRRYLREGTTEIRKWLGLAAREHTSTDHDMAALQQAAGATVALMAALDVMDRNPEALLPPTLRERLGRTFDEAATILRNGRYPAEINWEPPPVDTRLPALAASIFADIEDAIRGFAAPARDDAQAKESPAASSGFFMADAFTNPDHVYYALKTTAAALFCYLLYSLLDWPGIHTAFLTCYIVSLGTTAESVEKLTLRIFGSLVGAAIGIAAIVFLVPWLTSIGSLMVAVFCGAYVSAYVAGGGPRISYAGFQIAFAFFLCVVQGSAPAFDMTIARDRVIGILIGNLVVYLVFTTISPMSVARRIDPAIAALLRRLGAMMTAADRSTRCGLAAQAQGELAAIETDIELARYEPERIRPARTWFAVRRRTARAIRAVEGALLLSANHDAASSADIATRLGVLADRFAAGEAGSQMSGEEPHAEQSSPPLFRIVVTGLRRLEEAVG
jgi:multidrug resistance protein MdtO